MERQDAAAVAAVLAGDRDAFRPLVDRQRLGESGDPRALEFIENVLR